MQKPPVSYARTILNDIELKPFDVDEEAQKIFDDIVHCIAQRNYAVKKDGIHEVLELQIAKTEYSAAYGVQCKIRDLFERESEGMRLEFHKSDERIYTESEDRIIFIGFMLCCIPGCFCVNVLGKPALKVRIYRK